MTNCISFVADNLANPDLNLLQDLEKQLQIHFSDRCRLAILIHRLYDYGSIIILRNRSSDPNTGYSIVKELLVQLQEAVEFFDHEVKFKGRTYSKEPILFFMLNEGLFQEPTSPSNKIWLKSLSKPVPVDDVMIKSWAEKYSHSSSASNKVVARVSKIAKEIKPQEDVGKCPSVVIESICNHFNIPLQNVLNL